jgi:hypothetical protein
MWTNLLNCSTFDGQYFADLFTVDYAQVYEIENPYGQDALQITPFIAPLIKCHIITLREMQKIKMNTSTPNQNKYNTKNALASRPNKLKKKKKKTNPTDPHRSWVCADPFRPWSRGSGEHT